MVTETDKKVDDAAEGSGDEEETPQQELKFYLMPSNAFTIIVKDWVRFVLLTGVIYIFHLIWMCWGVDAYSSFERHLFCTDG